MNKSNRRKGNMKKGLSILLVLVLGMSMLMATTNQGSWSSSDTDGIDAEGNSATMTVSFDLSGSVDDDNESVTIGFSASAVDSLEADVTPTSTATLENQDGVGKLNEDRYIFWQISSPSKLEVSLSWPAQMTGKIETNKLGWTITSSVPVSATTSSTAANVTNGDVIEDSDNTAKGDNSNTAVVLDRRSGFNYGTVGSQQLIIETASLDSATIDSYSATLTLTVKAV